MSFQVEKGIEPLVRALNKLDFASTVYSCEGHFDGGHREIFLPTAYVTFGVSDVTAFARFYKRLRAFHVSTEAAGLRLTYDCVLGRYTLSVWSDAPIESPREKRTVIDTTVAQLAHIVEEYAPIPQADEVLQDTFESNDRHPCGESVPPCMLVIPPKELMCPFVQLLKEGLENSSEREARRQFHHL
jgi:hypothetical protein